MIKIISGFLFLLIMSTAGAQSAKRTTKGKTVKWYNKYECLTALNLQPDESIDQQQFAKQYARNRKWWDAAFAYLKNTNLASLAPGNYPIDGEDVFIKVTEAISKDIDSSKWESHYNYHDIHVLVSGKEMIGITPVKNVTAITAYDKTRDILFYTGTGPYFLADTNRFFIIFSNEAHRPFIKLGGYEEKVKRVVIKVRNPDIKN